MLVLGSMTRMPIRQEYMLYMAVLAGFTAVSVLAGFLCFGRRAEHRGLLLIGSIGTSLPFGIPLIESVWGSEGLLVAFLLDIPNVLAVFGLAAGIAHGYSPLAQQPDPGPDDVQRCPNPIGPGVPPQPAEPAPAGQAEPGCALGLARLTVQLCSNAPFVAILVAITVNLSTLPVPDYLIALARSMGVAVTPLILILSGVSLELTVDRSHLWLVKLPAAA